MNPELKLLRELKYPIKIFSVGKDLEYNTLYSDGFRNGTKVKKFHIVTQFAYDVIWFSEDEGIASWDYLYVFPKGLGPEEHKRITEELFEMLKE